MKSEIIYFLSIIAMCSSCKKTSVEPNATLDNSSLNVGPYHQPLKVQTYTAGFDRRSPEEYPRTFIYSYNSEGLLSHEDCYADTVKNSMAHKIFSIDFFYDQGKMIKSIQRYYQSPFSFGDSSIQNIKEFGYKGDILQTYQGNKGPKYTFYYDSLGHVDYLLGRIGTNVYDSISISYTNSAGQYEGYSGVKFGESPFYPDTTFLDSSTYFSVSTNLQDRSSSFSDELNGQFTLNYSPLVDHFQKEVKNSFFDNYPFNYPEHYLCDLVTLPYFSGWEEFRSETFSLEYTLDDKARIIKINGRGSKTGNTILSETTLFY